MSINTPEMLADREETLLKEDALLLIEKDREIRISKEVISNRVNEITSVSPNITQTLDSFDESVSKIAPEGLLKHNEMILSQHGLV